MIKIANNKINKIMLGNDEIVKVYLGNDLIYQNKKWVFQKKGLHYYWDYQYKDTFFIDEGSHLFVLTEGGMLFVDIMGGGKEIISGGIMGKDVDNANVIVVKNGKITMLRGKFNLATKIFTNSYTIAENVPNNYFLTAEVYSDHETDSYYEYYKLE